VFRFLPIQAVIYIPRLHVEKELVSKNKTVNAPINAVGEVKVVNDENVEELLISRFNEIVISVCFCRRSKEKLPTNKVQKH
jgi:hypothetical protein